MSFSYHEPRAGSLGKTEASSSFYNTTAPQFASTWLIKFGALWVIDLASYCALLLQQLSPFQSIFAEYSFLEIQSVSTVTVVRQDHSKAVACSTSTTICSVGQGRKGSWLQERGVDISSREASQQPVQNEHKATLHSWPPPAIPLKSNWYVPLSDFTITLLFLFLSVAKNNEAKI